MPSLSALVDCIAQLRMHFLIAERDLVYFLNYEVAQDRHGLSVLATDCELTAASVLVESNQRASI